MWKQPGRFGADQRGGTAVQALVFLPVILMSLVILMFFWQTLTIRRSLHTGTYLATRYLSLYPPESTDQLYWAEIAKKFIWAELKNNPWVDQNRVNDTYSLVEVFLVGGVECQKDFTVKGRYAFFAPLSKSDSGFLPRMQPYEMVDERTGKIICKD